MVTETDSGYSTMAEFKIAAGLVSLGDVEGAVEVYEGLADNSSLSDRFRGLAALLVASNLMDSASSVDLIARLEPLAIQGGDWFFSATELLGVVALKDGDLDGAYSRFSSITLDPTAPSSLKQRAQEVLELIDSQKPQEFLFEDISEPVENAEEKEEGNYQ
jgi:hypothetical protein